MELLRTLPGDDIRQIMWRYADRFDVQMIVQSARAVARGPVARAVAEGARKSHEWTEIKNNLLQAFDESGITAAYMDPEHGGFVDGPKNMVLALMAFELAWVDAGSATASLAGNLALAPIHDRGTKAQYDEYMARATPPQPGEDRKIIRGSFALTEPLPYVGVDTGVLCGKLRVAEWKDGEEPILEVDKRGRFITNMDYANFVTAAVETDDPRIKSSCMVIIEETDPGIYDRGAVTMKMVHQLSSTRDPIINVRIPAHRIIGGYTVKDGVIIPNYSHSEVIEAVFRRTRVTVAIMTSAKLLSAIEPVIRYHRTRFRGGEYGEPGSPRFEHGIQMKEDALHRLVDVWTAGEAGASLGFEAARIFDIFDPMEKDIEAYFSEQGLSGRKRLMAMRKVEQGVIEQVKHGKVPDDDDLLGTYASIESLANVYCPACKLWNTGWGATMMREAVAMMGGYGITEDCPGFLMNKWADSQLEATYEGPEAVQRRQLSVTMINPLFLAHFEQWILQMKAFGSTNATLNQSASVVASGMTLWNWTLKYLQESKDVHGAALYHSNRQGITFSMADALSWLLAGRSLIMDTLELEQKGIDHPVVAEGFEGTLRFYADLCAVQAMRAVGEASRICAEMVYGYAIDGAESKAATATFAAMRVDVEYLMTGLRIAKDEAAKAVAQVMIPEALDYPL